MADTHSHGAVRSLHLITSTARRGAEVFAYDLAEPLRRRGLQVELLAVSRGSGSADLPVEALGNRRLSRAATGVLRAKMRACDLVIAHGSVTLPAAALASIGMRVPIIYRSIGDSRAWAGTWRRRLQVRFLLRRTAAIVALWDEAAAAIVERYGVSAERVHVIPNAVTVARFRPPTAEERRQARARFGVADDRPVVAFVGALSQEKNPALAVRMVAALPEARLLIAGDGPQRLALESLAAERMPSRALFLGSLDGITSVYWAADALVLPSRTEGMPAAPIEAALCGLPTVASRVGALPQIVVDGRTGALFDPGATEEAAVKLRAVLEDPEELGAAAREHCLDRFNIDDVADLWADVIALIVQA